MCDLTDLRLTEFLYYWAPVNPGSHIRRSYHIKFWRFREVCNFQISNNDYLKPHETSRILYDENCYKKHFEPCLLYIALLLDDFPITSWMPFIQFSLTLKSNTSLESFFDKKDLRFRKASCFCLYHAILKHTAFRKLKVLLIIKERLYHLPQMGE